MKRNMKMAILAMSAILALGTTACSKSGGATVEPTAQTGTKEQTGTDREAGTEAAADADIPKPEKVTMMIDTAYGQMRDEKTWASFEVKMKESLGIEVKLTKPDHNQYYEQLNLAFTSGNPPDVMEIGSINYPSYAGNGALWDMTPAWESSELKASGIVDEKYVDAVKIDNILYGFPMMKGNGTVTFLRQDWLDNLGLSVPTNYEEFMTVLKAFTFDDPDKNGQNDTYGFTAAGLIHTETPYTMYMREFYQDATPDFYEKSGAFIDGMSEPAMVAALQRMKDAYAAGYMDKEIITNKTSTCRDKLYASQVGAFNYWAGNWNVQLEDNLQASNPDAKLVPIPPIAETKYIERPSTVLAITTAAKNPEGIFKYIIEYSHDGGEGQLLFTRGIEGENYEKTADGTYAQLPDPESPERVFEKSFYAPELSFTKFEDPIQFDERILNSLKIFEANSEIAPVPRTSETISSNLVELVVIKNNVIANCVTGALSPEEAIAQYESQGKTYIEAILADLNQ